MMATKCGWKKRGGEQLWQAKIHDLLHNNLMNTTWRMTEAI
uniref:Uncharacterized protein n=1 Tax=Rhizophora mucronata TaxID=61149 RepID=A0A2P2MVM2_RHIMU